MDISYFIKNMSKYEVLILAALPFIGSFVALLYETGYMAFYEIPISFIKVDFNRIVVSTAVVFLLFFIILKGFFSACKFVLTGHPARRAFFQPLVPALIFFLASNFLLGMANAFYFSMLVFIVFSLIQFLFPLFLIRNGQSYLKNLSEQISKDEENMDKIGGPGAAGIIFLIFVLSFFVVGVGLNDAADKKEYLVLLGDKDRVVVDIYDDIVITKKFDRNTNYLKDGFFVIKINDQREIGFSRIKIGTLKNEKFVVRNRINEMIN